MSKLLEIKNLSVDFKLRENVFRAVDNISFEIDKNQTLALVGESGSGKSVTAMSILKLLPYPKAMHPKNSKIIFEGENILEFDNKSLRQVRGNIVSMIFQEPMTSLNPFSHILLNFIRVLALLLYNPNGLSISDSSSSSASIISYSVGYLLNSLSRIPSTCCRLVRFNRIQHTNIFQPSSWYISCSKGLIIFLIILHQIIHCSDYP